MSQSQKVETAMLAYEAKLEQANAAVAANLDPSLLWNEQVSNAEYFAVALPVFAEYDATLAAAYQTYQMGELVSATEINRRYAMNQTATPRTDAAYNSQNDASGSAREMISAMLDLSRTLERELAAMTAERDRLLA